MKSERKKANGPRGKPRGSGSGSGSGSGGKRGGRRPAAKGKRSKRDAKLDDDRHRFEIYRTIPQRHYVAMSGRQSKILHEQASRYGLPFAGRVINLEELLRAFHSFLAANARRLSSPDPTTDPLLLGGATPALERYRDERAQIARLDRLERERELVSREEARRGFGLVANVLRNAGQTLGRQFGVEAQIILIDALDEADRGIRRMFNVD